MEARNKESAQINNQTEHSVDLLGYTEKIYSDKLDQPGTSETKTRHLNTSGNHLLQYSSSNNCSYLADAKLVENQQGNKIMNHRNILLINAYLFIAVRENDTQEEKVKRFQKYLDEGADINHIDRNDNDNTCLHVAVLENEPEIVRLLLVRGAVVDIKNANGKTPLDIAEQLQHLSIINMLKTFSISNQKVSINSQFLCKQESKTNLNSNKKKKTENKPEEGVTQYLKQNKQQSRKKYRKQGLHGDIYQLKLLMLFLKRGLDNGYCFRLATEKREARKFDDLFFEITDKDNKKEYRLLQAKHKEDESTRITFNNLLTESDSDYSLVKYFFSYIDSKKELFNKGIIKDVTVCTNINFDLHDKLNGKIKILDTIQEIKNNDYILNMVEETHKKGSMCYRFNKNIIPLLKPVLMNYNLTRLAKRLVECFLKNNPIQHHNKNDVFQPYHTALAKEVINTNKKLFFEDFVNGSNTLSREAALFREIFQVEIKKQSKELSLENSNMEIANKFNKTMAHNRSKENVGLNLSKGFGIGGQNNWPNDVISDEDINDFIDHLVFAVNQPNEELLGEIIENEISKEFNFSVRNYVYNELFVNMLNWLKGKGEEFISNEDGKTFFDNVKMKLCELQLIGVTLDNNCKMKDFNINFKLDTTRNKQFHEFLTSKLPQKQILNVRTKQNTLSSIKIYQILNNMTEYKNNNSYIFMELNSVLRLQDCVIQAFRGSCNLLVINCKHSETDINVDKLYSHLSNIIHHSSNKKIILITRENDSLANKFKSNSFIKIAYEEMTDDSIQFLHLTPESQKNLLENTKIMFQGKEVSLCNLIHGKSRYLIREELLYKIISHERIEVGNVPSTFEVVCFYMPRNLRIFFSNNNIRKGDFDVKLFDNSLVNISELIWKECDFQVKLQGSFNPQFQNKQAEKKSKLKLKAETGNIIVLADEPGSGKSTVLSYLEVTFKRFDGTLWIERINLNDHSKSLSKAEFNDIGSVVDFLLDTVNLETLLEKKIFKHRIYKEGKIIFLFDGFDEICPNYKRKVIKLLKFLKGTKVEKLWITTRPHMIRELEDELDITLYVLEPLSHEVQTGFLMNYFNSASKTDNKKSLDFYYAEKLLDIVSSSFVDKDRDFTGIPLHLRMIAEAFQDNFQEYCDSNQKILNLPQKLDLVYLYKLFIKKKYDLYCKEKVKADLTKPSIKETYKKLYPSFILEHKLAAAVALFQVQDISIILSDEERKQIEDFLRDIKEGKERTGIISYLIDDRPHFIHQTYAEYFVVELIFDKLKLCPSNIDLWNFVIKFFLEDYQNIRKFFDHKLAVLTGKDLADLEDGDLADFSLQIGCSMICEIVLTPNIFECILCVAVNENLENVVIWLLKSVEGNKGTDFIRTVFYHTVLYLVNNDNDVALEKLLECENDVGNCIMLEHTSSNGYKLPSYLGIEEKSLRIFNIFLKFIENSGKIALIIKLFGMCLTTVQLTHNLLYGSFLIQYFMKRYYYAIKRIHDFLEHIDSRDRKSIIDAKFGDGKSFLHLACGAVAKFIPYKLSLIKLLIREGADVDAQDNFGTTPLHISVAAYNGWNLVQCLVDKAADVNIADECGKTPLHLTAHWGNLKTLKFLVEEGGADIKAVDNKGKTALHLAVENHLLKSALNTINERTDLEEISESISCYCDVLRDTVEMVEYLVDKGSDINAVDGFGRNALHCALINYRLGVSHCAGDGDKISLNCDTQLDILKILKYLLELGTELEVIDNLETASMVAVNNAFVVAKYYVDKEIGLKCSDTDDTIPLDWAPKSITLEMIKYLVDKEADFKAVDNHGTTVLHQAVISQAFGVVQYLVDKGADLDTADEDGKTPLDSAAQSGSLEMVTYLLKKVAHFYCIDNLGTLFLLVKNCMLGLLIYLLDKGVDLSSTDECYRTLLQWSIQFGN